MVLLVGGFDGGVELQACEIGVILSINTCIGVR